MAFNRDNIVFQVRYSAFTFEGQTQDLKSDRAKLRIPDGLLQQFINTAQLQTNMEIEEDRNERFANTVKDADEMALPADFLFMRFFVIYDDFDDVNTPPTGQSTYHKGRPIQQAWTYSDLLGNSPIASDFGNKTTFVSQSETGQPNKYMIFERDNGHYAKFDLVSDHNYYVEFGYVTLPANMTAGGNNPEISEQYQMALVDYVRFMVAQTLGDRASKREFLGDYERNKAIYLQSLSRVTMPKSLRSTTIYDQDRVVY